MFRPTSAFNDLLNNASSQLDDIQPISYEDSIFKDMSKDLISAQKKSTILSIIAIIISGLTLIVAIITLILQFQ